MRLRRAVEIAAEPATLFELTQDYARRLDWDPFLKEARLVGGASAAALGARAWCVARSGFGMETRYVSFQPPSVCAVEMTAGPWFLRTFAGSWRFEQTGPARTRVSFTYQLVARPRILSGLLAALFALDTRRRLDALKSAAESATIA
jgi:ribosome-associated toxin RatA of RatAB toxin-antitoxin module